MAAAAKAVGAILAVLGVVALLGGLVAAAVAWSDINHERDRLVPDRERIRDDEQALAMGAAVAVGGLVTFLAGLLAMVLSRPKAVPAPPATGPAATAPSTRSERAPDRIARSSPETGRRNIVVAAAVALGLVALLVIGLLAYMPGRSGGGFFNGGSEPEPVVVDQRTFNGTLQGGSLGLDLPPFQDGGQGGFTPQAKASACRLVLDWDGSQPGGAETLHLKVTRTGATPVEAEGGPGLEVSLVDVPMARHQYEVSLPADAVGAVSQPYSLSLTCVA